ncbi:hypothetical protein DDE74_01740 [Streptomyces lydicus]|uniref:Uncharacterized protein n=1 Tax=Streptomyces lydicus TaxID=47763 RepID=A0A3Q9JZ42_9ACTN|nr:hypothetical protein DDE74_01740 [Streptomyces lydicus]
MRYAQGDGLTPLEQEKRERLRLEAVERFARGEVSRGTRRPARAQYATSTPQFTRVISLREPHCESPRERM